MAKKKLTIDDVLVPKEEIPYEVPENWCWVKLGTVTEIVTGNTPSKKCSEYYGEYLPFVKPADLDQGRKLSYSTESLSEIGAQKARVIPKYSTAVCCIGSIGKSAFLEVDVATNQQINCAIPKGINSLYLYYYILSEECQTQLWENSSATTISIINKSKMSNLNIPIPPLAEQERIVNRIESLFDKVDKAVCLVAEAREGFEKRRAAILERAFIPPLAEQERIVNRIESLFDKVDKAVCLVAEAREGFEKRRAAILERAFSGELTKKWREDNGVEFNEEKIALSEVVSINPKKPKLEFNDEQICSFVPMAAVSDVNGKIEAMEERPYAKVKKGYTYFEEDDVLFAKITPCMENGKACIAEGLNNRFGFGTTEFHVLRCGEKVLNKYLYYLVRAKWFREEAKQYMTGAVGQQRVPKTYLEDYEVLIPSIEEQEEVVRLLEYMLDKEFEVEYLCDIEDKVELLKKSILSRAFRGELGSNNLNEESSIELLKDLIK